MAVVISEELGNEFDLGNIEPNLIHVKLDETLERDPATGEIGLAQAIVDCCNGEDDPLATNLQCAAVQCLGVIAPGGTVENQQTTPPNPMWDTQRVKAEVYSGVFTNAPWDFGPGTANDVPDHTLYTGEFSAPWLETAFGTDFAVEYTATFDAKVNGEYEWRTAAPLSGPMELFVDGNSIMAGGAGDSPTGMVVLPAGDHEIIVKFANTGVPPVFELEWDHAYSGLLGFHKMSYTDLAVAQSGPDIWLKADDGVNPATDGDPVVDWTSHDANGLVATVKTGTPTFVEADPLYEYNPSLAFVAGDSMQLDANWLPEQGLPFTIFAVAQGTGWAWHLGDPATAGASVGLHLVEATQDYTAQSTGSQATQNDTTIPVGDPILARIDVKEDGVWLSINGQDAVNSGVPIALHPPANPDDLFLIGEDGNGGVFDGEVAEILLLPSVPDVLGTVKLATYLGIKYGVPLRHDYVLSDNTVAFEDDNTYTFDKVVIARDDAMGLNQTIRSGIGMTIRNGNNIEGGVPLSTDLTATGVSHDDGQLNLIDETDLSSACAARTALTSPRIIKIMSTNPDTFLLTFDGAGMEARTNSLLLADDTGFTAGLIIVPLLYNDADDSYTAALTVVGEKFAKLAHYEEETANEINITYDIGKVEMFITDTAPEGYIAMNGDTFNDADYPEFAEKLHAGETAAAVDNADGTFTVLDLNMIGQAEAGRFPGGLGDQPAGTLEDDQNREHTHDYTRSYNNKMGYIAILDPNNPQLNRGNTTQQTGPEGGVHARPLTFRVLWCLKALPTNVPVVATPQACVEG